jgi:hypothetical protein
MRLLSMLRSGYANPQCGLPGSVSPLETLEGFHKWLE